MDAEPLQPVGRDRAESAGDKRAASTDKNLLELDGASHYDLYDRPRVAGEALKTVARFQDKL